MLNVISINEETFDAEVLHSAQPVIIGFWTDGCRPCQRLGQVIRKFADQVKVLTCDVDHSPGLASKLGIMNIPTLLFFRDGHLVERAIGTVNDISEVAVGVICDTSTNSGEKRGSLQAS